MRRVIWFLSAIALLVAGCGGGGSVFQSTPTTSGSGTTTTLLSGPDGASGDELPVPDESTVISTGAWGEVFDSRILVRVTDAAGPAAGAEVAAALGGEVAAGLDRFLIFQIEIPAGGEAAIAAALEASMARADVLVAAPLEVVRPAREVVPRPCGPLDAPELQGEDRADQYRLIGVEDAWRLIRAAEVATAAPTVGIVDGFGSSVGFHGSWVSQVVDAADRPGNPPGVLDAVLGDAAAEVVQVEVFGDASLTSTDAWMKGAAQAIDQGATVVNLSVGSTKTPEGRELVRQWLRDMAADHPDVLFVAAAGNNAGDAAEFGPGGLDEPNLVTVGGLDHQGDRWEETRTDADGVEHTVGSNYIGSGGEVTLAVIGQDVYTGMNTDGAPVTQSGTSFAAPQVTAAVAVLQALDPTLTPQQIKQILVETAATEIADPAISDRIVAVDPALGGRVLRLDDAVWRVLTERLGVTGAREEMLGKATLQVRARPAEDDPLTFRIVATAPGGGDGTEVKIAVNGSGVLNPGEETLSTDDDVARWRWSFLRSGASALATLTRADTGACARLLITAAEGSIYAGEYEGSFVLFPSVGWPTVAFTLTIDEGGAVVGDGGVTDTHTVTGGSRSIDMTLHCEGAIDAHGTLTCSGPVVADVAITYSDGTTNANTATGTIQLDLVIGPDGTLTGTATDESDTRPVEGRAVSGGPAGLP